MVKGLADVTEDSPNFFARMKHLTESVIKKCQFINGGLLLDKQFSLL